MIENEEDIFLNCTNEPSKTIKAIDKESVYKICSGQVVFNLAIAVKELVENSLDAGSTIIEVKLRDYGLELIEVSDNGSGVDEDNFEGLTARYHTSKLREFSDLECVPTFGFRGEALSSLCSVSNMTIITRHEKANCGTKLEINNHGVITKKQPHARQVGTTVTIMKLFSALPVRKIEFKKNIKKEFSKMCQILQAYCLVAKKVKIICTNQNQKGVKSTIINTQGGASVIDNISCVFGSKQVADLVEFKPPIGTDENYRKALFEKVDMEDSLNGHLNLEEIDKLNLSQFKINGWISSCAHGSGRSSKDRQYFYVNSRPCEPQKIMKLINEIYHRYNVHQNPFVYLNLKIKRSDVDVNLTPDKRQVLINNENILLLALKKSLIKTFDEIAGIYKMQNVPIKIEKNKKSSRKDNDDNNGSDDSDPELKSSSKMFSQMLSQWKLTGSTDKPCKEFKISSNKRKCVDEITERTSKLKKIQSILEVGSSIKSTMQINDHDQTLSYLTDPEDEDDEKIVINCKLPKVESPSKKDIDITCSTPEKKYPEVGDQIKDMIYNIDCKVLTPKSVKIIEPKSTPQKSEQIVQSVAEPISKIKDEKQEEIIDIDLIVDAYTSSAKIVNSGIIIKTSLNDIRKQMEQEKHLQSLISAKANLNKLKFKIKIDPTGNKIAEEELRREISKDSFAQMEIIGQFNLGFIIVRLDDDLFIIDQHASDEKYNFEWLQKTTTLQHQKLVIPQQLELTAAKEILLMDNLSVFKLNGFSFIIDEGAVHTKKVKLSAKPFSKNWEFGKEDIDEMLFMLEDAPTNVTFCRPSRVRTMFASRACRKSVMIGMALSKSDMRKLVNHMGEIEHPWHCPHGRPTMRHLINLKMLQDIE